MNLSQCQDMLWPLFVSFLPSPFSMCNLSGLLRHINYSFHSGQTVSTLELAHLLLQFKTKSNYVVSATLVFNRHTAFCSFFH